MNETQETSEVGICGITKLQAALRASQDQCAALLVSYTNLVTQYANTVTMFASITNPK